MKRISFFRVFLLLIVFSAPAMAVLTEFTYSPVPANMYNLDHWKWYKWKIDLTSAPGYTIGTVITEATLTFHDIYNWDDKANVMYIHLLDIFVRPANGNKLTSDIDNQGGGDQFAGKGVWIDSWQDVDGGNPNNAKDLVYTFSLLPDGRNILFGTNSLNSYASDGYIAFGIDPDCHYWNDGVEFKIYTSPNIPAPGAILLGGIGVALVGWLRRRQMI